MIAVYFNDKSVFDENRERERDTSRLVQAHMIECENLEHMKMSSFICNLPH